MYSEHPARRASAGEIRAALAVMAAVSGTAFASGRETVLFFSQLGPAAWPAMIIAPALFALLVRAFGGFARKTGADSVPGVFLRLLGPECARVIGLLHGLLMLLAGMMMLKTCGEIGALTLPVRHGFLTGMLAALLLALAICAGRLRFLPVMGLAAAVSTVLFYAALGLDPRPVRTHVPAETVLRLSGNMKAAVMLAVLHSCLNAAMSAHALAAFSGERPDPTRTARLSGLIMLLCLLSVHCALLRGGTDLFSQALPGVLLAARWGAPGFWLSAAHMYLLSACTLSACMDALVALRPRP